MNTNQNPEIAFRQWLRQVDACIQARCGLSSADLADQPYRDQYEDGISAPEAAYEALEAEGFEFETEELDSLSFA